MLITVHANSFSVPSLFHCLNFVAVDFGVRCFAQRSEAR